MLDFIMRRRAALFFFIFTVASFTAAGLSGTVRGSVMLTSALVFLMCVILTVKIRIRRRHSDSDEGESRVAILRRFTSAASAALVLACAVSGIYFDSYCRNISALDGQSAEIDALITEVAYSGGGLGSYYADVQSLNGSEYNFKALLSCADNSLVCGDIIRTYVTFASPQSGGIGFDEGSYLLSKNIAITAESEGETVLCGTSRSLKILTKKLNFKLSGILKSYIHGDAGGFASALLLNEGSSLSNSTARDFRRCGISHLLALSGLHLTVITFAVSKLLARLHVRKKRSALITALLALSYTALCGFPASLVRSALMVTFTSVGRALGRRTDSYLSLTLSASVIIAASPFAALDVSLQLSFWAMLACIASEKYFSMLRPRITKLFPARLWRLANLLYSAVYIILITLTVSIFTLPTVASTFGEYSLVAPLANVVFVPLVNLILGLLPAVLILSPIPALAAIPAACAGYLTDLSVSLAARISDMEGITVSLRYPGTSAFILATSVCMFMFFIMRPRRAKLLSLTAVALTSAVFLIYVAGCSAIYAGQVSVLHLNNKSNDALCVISDTDVLICDISDGHKSTVRLGVCAAQEHCMTEISSYMLTHYHRAHITSFGWLSDTQKVRSLILPEAVSEEDTEIQASLTGIAARKNIAVYIYPSDGDNAEVLFRSAMLTVPPRTCISRSKHPVISFTVSAAGGSVLYAGSSVSESGLNNFFENSLASSDAVIFGCHNPVNKQIIAPDVKNIPSCVIYSGDSRLYVSDSFADAAGDTANVIEGALTTEIVLPSGQDQK